MATITSSNPPAVRSPTGYTHGLLLEGVERRLIVSGQVGMAPDDSVPCSPLRPEVSCSAWFRRFSGCSCLPRSRPLLPWASY